MRDRLYLARKRFALTWHIYRRSSWTLRAAWKTSGDVEAVALAAIREERLAVLAALPRAERAA